MEIISKYLEDRRFIQWVFHPDNELEEWWSTHKTGNPKEKQNIQLARNVLLNLKTTDQKLSEEEKIILFSGILKQIEARQESQKKVKKLTVLLRYAAVAILFFAIGALLFYEQNKFNPEFNSQNITVPIDENDAKLIRSNGESILLEEKRSVIEYNEDGKILINDKEIETTSQSEKRTPDLNQLVIPYGKTSEIVLSDGTRVHLNAGSKLVYPEFFDGKNREVLLIGEAFFEVSENKKHPFIVQTTDLRIKVLGTKFNVSAYPTDNIIETVLTEGQVRLEENNAGLFALAKDLEPGQMAAFNKTSQETVLRNVDIDNHILWKEGLYKFESTDLSRVVKKLERYYNLRFHYSDPFLGAIKISGKLDLNNSREEILSRVSSAANVQIIKKGEAFYEIEK